MPVAQARPQQWESGVLECHRVKDCGLGCCCMLSCSDACIYGSAMERAGFGASVLWTLSTMTPLAWCVHIYGRVLTVEKYGIDEEPFTSVLVQTCCPCCGSVQVMNQILVHAHCDKNGRPVAATWGWRGQRGRLDQRGDEHGA